MQGVKFGSLASLLLPLLALTTTCIIHETDAYLPRMVRGRPRNGFLGAPGNKHHVGAIEEFKKTDPPPDQWYEQRLDHFDGSNPAVWQQRYFTNKSFYKPGGPLFVQIGGEGKANPIWLVEGAWLDYAKKYGAYCVLLEHRFYGDSHPTKNMSTENLKYLSSEQAMADLAAFITDQKKAHGLEQATKVIVFGGSYPGSLAAWFRMKYPHIAHGAVASSAPVVAKLNFFEYMEVVRTSLKSYDDTDGCNNAIMKATVDMQESMKTYDGRRKLKSLFQLCDDLDPNVSKDIMNFYSTLSGNFAEVVQYNKDNKAFEGSIGTNITIDTLCAIMTDSSKGDPRNRYAAVNSLMMKLHKEKCQDFKYDKMIDELRKTEWSSNTGGRQWTYQTCTEFAFYQSSDSDQQPFGHTFPIDFWLQQCVDIFGPSFNSSLIGKAVERSNEDYGALGIRISRVVFPNGSIDPWHALGVLEDLSPDARAVFITGTAHCANMYPASPDDLPALTQAREKIDASIGKWLTED